MKKIISLGIILAVSLAVVWLHSEQKHSLVKPAIVSRAEWQARESKEAYTTHRPSKITIHHSFEPNMSQYQGAASVRWIQNLHMDKNGWADVGYHFLLGSDATTKVATLFQGRPETVVGAHAKNNNSDNVGICLIGDFQVDELPEQSYAMLVDLVAWLCAEYNIAPNQIFGHCDFNETICPGGKLYQILPKLRQDVSAKCR